MKNKIKLIILSLFVAAVQNFPAVSLPIEYHRLGSTTWGSDGSETYQSGSTAFYTPGPQEQAEISRRKMQESNRIMDEAREDMERLRNKYK